MRSGFIPVRLLEQPPRRGYLPEASVDPLPEGLTAFQRRTGFECGTCTLVVFRRFWGRSILNGPFRAEGVVVPAPLAPLLKNKVLQPFGRRPAALPHVHDDDEVAPTIRIDHIAGAGEA